MKMNESFRCGETRKGKRLEEKEEIFPPSHVKLFNIIVFKKNKF